MGFELKSMAGPTRERQLFFERLKFTIIDSTKEELDDILRTLIRKDNAREFYDDLFRGCSLDKSGEIVRRGFFFLTGVSVPLEYAMYTLLAYAPEGFYLKEKIKSIRFIAPEEEVRRPLRFPRRLDMLPSLEQLGVVGWETGTVPKELARCRRLRYLSLRDNHFTAIPEAVTKIPGLTHLDMSFNRITTIPPSLYAMVKLENLSLKGNKLSSLPGDMNKFSSLRELDLSCNKLKALPDSLEKMPKLASLSVAYNSLSASDEARWESLFGQ